MKASESKNAPKKYAPDLSAKKNEDAPAVAPSLGDRAKDECRSVSLKDLSDQAALARCADLLHRLKDHSQTNDASRAEKAMDRALPTQALA